jgi:hypothetical protein
MVQHVVREERKLRMHIFSWQPTLKLLLQQRLGAPRPSCTTKVFLLLQILHAFIPIFVFSYMTYPILIFAMHAYDKGFHIPRLCAMVFSK